MRRFVVLVVTALAASLLPGAGGIVQAQEGVQVRIVRDGFGVPHVYSDTLEGVAYGAGYGIAQDRLFQLEVLRAVAKGRMTELFGPVPGFPEMDSAARRLFYTDAERREKLTRLPFRAQRMYAAYVDGINAWMDEVRSNPSLVPQEYAVVGKPGPDEWDVTDSLAIAEFLVETFGAGGGSELAQAELLAFLIDKYGQNEGLGAFDDIRWLNDPASPASIPRDFDWEAAPTFADPLPPKEWRRDARIGMADVDRRPLGPADDAPAQPAVGTLAQLGLVPDEPSDATAQSLADHKAGVEKIAEFYRFGSNAFITGPDRTASGGTIQLGAPQVGQFVPQIIAEWGLHSPANDLDMMGLTFAGAGPAVLIGRTPFFAWTTTTGNSDGADIYVLQLGEDPRTYVYDGQLEAMDCRTETINDKGGAPLRSEEVCRSRHGPVIAFDEGNGVAYALRRAWFDYETGTIEGFFGANFVGSVNAFATEINKLQSNHNMFYVDADGNYGYWHPGALPIRPSGTDVRLPQDGRFSATEWQRLRTAQEVPHAVNFPRGWLANWNNKPAVSWDNGDGANYGAVFRSQLWDDLLAEEPAMDMERGNELNRINATSELEFGFFREHIVRAGRASDDEQIQAAAEVLAAWDARREDTTGDGLVDSEPGYSLWKSWRTLARDLAFAEDLESFAGRSSDSMLLHVLDGDAASLPKSRDWLDGEPVDDFLNRVMRANLDALAEEFGSDDMDAWASDMPQQRYTRLNARFYDCEVGSAVGMPAACHESLPGNVRDLDYMNRGTYNHQVEFRPQPPPSGVLPDVLPATGWHVEDRGDRHVLAGSIISPGQSGFINSFGQQDPHYEDQHELYAGWEYKPMPLREADVLAYGGDRSETLTYEFSLAPVERAAGTDRIGTAVAGSQRAFDDAETVVFASAGDFPDALTAAPLAHDLGGPLLLVGSRLDDRVRTEIGRLGATEAVIVGGAAAVGEQAEADLQAAGLETRRVAGADRFATAAAVARELGDSFDEVFVSSGRSFADALSAGPVAASLGIPILLVEPERLPAATAQALDDLGAAQSWVLGGSAAVSDAVVEQLPGPQRLAGADRFATSVAVARFGLERGLGDGDVYVATGGAFPDGLTAGPVAAATGGVLLLVDGARTWSATPVFGHLANAHRAAETVVVFGGAAAVSADVAARAVLAVSQR